MSKKRWLTGVGDSSMPACREKALFLSMTTGKVEDAKQSRRLKQTQWLQQHCLEMGASTSFSTCDQVSTLATFCSSDNVGFNMLECLLQRFLINLVGQTTGGGNEVLTHQTELRLFH
jgi:hypothetical protein